MRYWLLCLRVWCSVVVDLILIVLLHLFLNVVCVIVLLLFGVTYDFVV